MTRWFVVGDGEPLFTPRHQPLDPETDQSPTPTGLSMTDFVEELRRYLKCAICGTRVQRIDRDIAPMRLATILTVHCHGATEVVEVSAAMIENMTKLDLAPAFSSKLLPGS